MHLHLGKVENPLVNRQFFSPFISFWREKSRYSSHSFSQCQLVFMDVIHVMANHLAFIFFVSGVSRQLILPNVSKQETKPKSGLKLQFVNTHFIWSGKIVNLLSFFFFSIPLYHAFHLIPSLVCFIFFGS